MTDDKMFEYFKKHLVLADVFQRLCLHYRKTGRLQKTLKINNIAKNDLSDINHFFGNDNVKNKYINIERFLEKIDEKSFIESLFKITGIEKINTKYSTEDESKILLKLKLLYPVLDDIHDYLNDKLGSTFFKKHIFELLNKACEITSFLINNNDEINDFSSLGSRFCNDSKLIRKNTQLYNLVGDFLYREIFTGLDEKYDRKLLFESVGVIDNPTSVTVTIYAPLVYTHKNGKVLNWIKQLWECGESATLSLDNINSLKSCFLEHNGEIELVTCENESPFNQMIRKEKLPVIYTAGYPNFAVKKLLHLLSGQIKQIHHWGDSDFDGLRIAEIINNISGVKLWRCTVDDSKTYNNRLKAVDYNKKSKIKNFLYSKPDFIFRRELEYSLENGWLEQEAWNK